MKAYQHILLTTDFSTFSEIVAQKAVNLAGHFNARITLLHVVEHVTENNSVDVSSDSDKSLIKEYRQRLEEFALSVPNLRVIPMVSLSKQTIENEILKVAKEIKADLIIIGAASKSSESMISNLNEEKIRKKSPCDVLVVHANAA